MNSTVKNALITSVPATAYPFPTPAEDLKALVAEKFLDWVEGTGSPFELLADSVQWRVEGEDPIAGIYDKHDLIDDIVTPFDKKTAGRLVPSEPMLFRTGTPLSPCFRRKHSCTAKSAIPTDIYG